MTRRAFLTGSITAAGAAMFDFPLGAAADSFRLEPDKDIIPAPADPQAWPEFRRQLSEWRRAKRNELLYSGALYARADFAWARRNFACYFLMLGDERFYDAATGRYRVKEWLDAGQRQFGGYDSVVLWHAYPRIGLDERNQFDFYSDQPGGLKGLRAVADELHAAGVKVFLDYNPWDTGTRRQGKPDIDALCGIVRAVDADGIFLDTMNEGAAAFRAKLDAVRPGVVLEGELALPLSRIEDHHLEWAQGFVDSETPGVIRNKWFERRHQMHHVARWNRDRTAEFQAAFMNGTGTLIWDNVFGSWVGYSQREKSILRAMLPIQRRFWSLFTGERWTPLVPTDAANVYASLWEDDGLRLWTLVNRATHESKVELPGFELQTGERLWDLISGLEVNSPATTIPSRGIGCFLAARREKLGADFKRFLKRQRAVAQTANWDSSFPSNVRTRLKRVQPAVKYSPDALPPGMALIPGGKFQFKVQFRIRECGWYESTPENITGWGRLHNLATLERQVVLASYAMDLTPVTNAEYARFLKTSGYQPRDSSNFLKHWRGGAPLSGHEEHPVVYVDINDTRAYAKWAGKRLPTEEEWQFAAQGHDGRKFSWGNQPPKAGDSLCNGYGAGTTPVKQFLAGRSQFGIWDLCGNTWEWTESERSDGVNRFVILRGGSYYQAKGSAWYMDGGPQEVSFGTKCLLLCPSLDRCSTVGFRCVADVAPT